MSELFSQKNRLLCGISGNNGLLAKPFKNFQNHLYGQPVLTFNKHQICSASCKLFNRVTLQHINKEYIMFIFYLIVLLKAPDTRGFF